MFQCANIVWMDVEEMHIPTFNVICDGSFVISNLPTSYDTKVGVYVI